MRSCLKSQRWFTSGLRLAGKIKGSLDYEIEPLYQFGSIANTNRHSEDTIGAFGGHFEAGYTFKSKYRPRIFTGYAFGSGDNDTKDKFYREFHGNVLNDNYIVADSSLIGDLSGITVGSSRASGMHVIVGGTSIDPFPKLNLNVDYHQFIAVKTPSGISKDLGGEVNLIAKYKLLPELDIIASANRFFTGKFFSQAAGSGRDIGYYYAQAQVTF